MAGAPQTRGPKTLPHPDLKVLRAMQPPFTVEVQLIRPGGINQSIQPGDGESGANLPLESVMAVTPNIVRLIRAGMLPGVPQGGDFRIIVTDAQADAVQWFFRAAPDNPVVMPGQPGMAVPPFTNPQQPQGFPMAQSQMYVVGPSGMLQPVASQQPMYGWASPPQVIAAAPSPAVLADPTANNEIRELRRHQEDLSRQLLTAQHEKDMATREAAWQQRVEALGQKVDALSTGLSTARATTADDPVVKSLQDALAQTQRRLDDELRRREQDALAIKIDAVQTATATMVKDAMAKVDAAITAASTRREDPMIEATRQMSAAAIEQARADVRRTELQLQSMAADRMRPQDIISMARELTPKDGTAAMLTQMGSVYGTMFEGMRSFMEMQREAGGGAESPWVRVVSDVVGQAATVMQQMFNSKAAAARVREAELVRSAAQARADGLRSASVRRQVASAPPQPALEPTPVPTTSSAAAPAPAPAPVPPPTPIRPPLQAVPNAPEAPDDDDEGDDDADNDPTIPGSPAWLAADAAAWGPAYPAVNVIRSAVAQGKITATEIIDRLLEVYLAFTKIPGMSVPIADMQLKSGDFDGFVSALLPDPPAGADHLVPVIIEMRGAVVAELQAKFAAAVAAQQPAPDAAPPSA